ncbi:MAG: hemin uptake protein HemP [Burkholderiales bacterium]|jgi:hemin uptake protein HemP|nr:hemin uptake protein HemP [Burkholderiales bacterium]
MTHPTEPIPPDTRVAHHDAPATVQRKGPHATGAVLRLPSRAIFAGAQEVEIDHNGAVYRLRQTSLGKLILTK